MTRSWDAAANRQKRHHTRKAKQVTFASLEDVAPSSSQMLFKEIYGSITEEIDGMDVALLGALVEAII